MPPLLSESEAGSDDLDMIPAKPVKKNKKEAELEEDDDVEAVNGAGGDEENEGSEDGETFAVEKILAHAFGDNDVLLYKVKWLGYEEEADHTWEPRENLEEGAADILQAYHKKIGGTPQPEDEKKGKGRGKGKRKATTATESPTPAAKRGRKSETNGAVWKAPTGSWENALDYIETISEDPAKGSKGKKDHTLNVFLVFSDGHKATFSLETVRNKCPQKLLDYFVAHLTFKEPAKKDEEV
ncbi:hypothetical protein B9Z65_8425 [Elsinoe australis]|uniref:Chromo domain-containing protein n=1 Tax=Elsinoe australis TaxID=40998 RepID=A0A2P7YDQ9_9PEZI|nr:hypothetical protein B9Z65_8425 [Elsinoe australis]